MIQTRTTLSEISKTLGVSIGTVSKSLSNSSEISVTTKKKVRDFARKCNYRPNNFAASFRKGYTKTIGLVIPSLLNPFYVKILVGIEKHLAENDYKLITSISNESKNKESKSLANMGSGYIDGLIICVSKETELMNRYTHVNRLISQGTPVVMFDRISQITNCDKVIINDYKVSFDAIEYLIENKGCKNILFTSSINNLRHGKLRTEGFKAALQKRNILFDNRFINVETSLQLKQELYLRLRNDPTIDGVFGANEMAVAQIIQTLHDLKSNDHIRNIEITGFCNHRLAEYNPSLIVINQNAEAMGVETAKRVLKRIQNPNEDYDTRIITSSLF